MNKKLISLLLCAFLIFSAAMPIWAEETVEETALRKMVITSEEEFLELAENCRLDAYSQNLEVILVVDLDLTGYEFEGIREKSPKHYISIRNFVFGISGRNIYRKSQRSIICFYK